MATPTDGGGMGSPLQSPIVGVPHTRVRMHSRTPSDPRFSPSSSSSSNSRSIGPSSHTQPSPDVSVSHSTSGVNNSAKGPTAPSRGHSPSPPGTPRWMGCSAIMNAAAANAGESFARFRPPSPHNVVQVLDRWSLAGVKVELPGSCGGTGNDASDDPPIVTTGPSGMALGLLTDLPAPVIVPEMFRHFSFLPSSPPSEGTTTYSFHPASPPGPFTRTNSRSQTSSQSGHSTSGSSAGGVPLAQGPGPAAYPLNLASQSHAQSASSVAGFAPGTGHTDPPPAGPDEPAKWRVSSSGSGTWARANGGRWGAGAGGAMEAQEQQTIKEESPAAVQQAAQPTGVPTSYATVAAGDAGPGAVPPSVASLPSTTVQGGSFTTNTSSPPGSWPSTASTAPNSTNTSPNAPAASRCGGSEEEASGEACPRSLAHPFSTSLPPVPAPLLQLSRPQSTPLLLSLLTSLIHLAAEQPRAWAVFDDKARKELDGTTGSTTGAGAVIEAAAEMVAGATVTPAAAAKSQAAGGGDASHPHAPSLAAQSRWIYSHIKHCFAKKENRDRWHSWKGGLRKMIERILSQRSLSLARLLPRLIASKSRLLCLLHAQQAQATVSWGTSSPCSANGQSPAATAAAALDDPLKTYLAELNSLLASLRRRAGKLWRRIDDALDRSVLQRWDHLHSADEANEAFLAELARVEGGADGADGGGAPGRPSVLAALQAYFHLYSSLVQTFPGRLLLSGLFRNRVENAMAAGEADGPLEGEEASVSGAGGAGSTNSTGSAAAAGGASASDPLLTLSFEDLVLACTESTSILVETLEGFVERAPDVVEQVIDTVLAGDKAQEANHATTGTTGTGTNSAPGSGSPSVVSTAHCPSTGLSSSPCDPLSLLSSLSFHSFLTASPLLPRLFTPATFQLLKPTGRLVGRSGRSGVRDVVGVRLVLGGKWQEAVWRWREQAEEKEELWVARGGDEADGDDGREEAAIADRLEEWMAKYVVAGEFVTSAKTLGGGFTTTKLVTLSPDDLLVPGVSDKPVEVMGVYKPKPRVSLWSLQSMKDGLVSNHRKEVAAYRLDRLLGLKHVPLTKSIILDECEGSLQLYIQDCVSARAISQLSIGNPKQPGKFDAPVGARASLPRSILLFDYLLDNRDRNLDNYLLSTLDGRPILIDHSWTHQTPRVVKDMDVAVQGEEAVLKRLVPGRRMLRRMEWLMESSRAAKEKSGGGGGANKSEKEAAQQAEEDAEGYETFAHGGGVLEKEMQFLLTKRDVDGIKHRMEVVLSYIHKEISLHGADAVFAEAEAEEALFRRRRHAAGGFGGSHWRDRSSRREDSHSHSLSSAFPTGSPLASVSSGAGTGAPSSSPPAPPSYSPSPSPPQSSQSSVGTPMTTASGGLVGKLEQFMAKSLGQAMGLGTTKEGEA